jgi:hypothetical protein
LQQRVTQGDAPIDDFATAPRIPADDEFPAAQSRSAAI